MTVRRPARAAALALLWALGGASLHAQSVGQTTADSARNARDTVDLSAEYLKGEARARIRLPVIPRLDPDGILPDGSRIVLDAQAIEWATAQTVGGLLLEVPGLYLWRGGWVGRPAYASYQGRGATSVEYLLDGLPVTPMGPDSVGVDPVLLPLNLLDRIEIERWAGLLRVRMYTPRHASAAAATELLIATGDRSTARYGGSIQKRFESGIAYALAADYWDAPTYDAASSAARETNAWLQLSYLHQERWGVQAQYILQSPDRDPYVAGSGDTLGAGVKGTRGDFQLRGFIQGGEGELQRRADLVFTSTGWSGSDVSQRINGVGLVTSWRRPTFSASASGFLWSRWTQAELRGNVGWAPTGALSASLEGAWLSYDDQRSGQWLGARAGAVLPYGFGLSGSARVGKVVAAPSIADNAAQSIHDLMATASWRRSWLELQVDLSRTGAFTPLAPQPYLNVPGLAGSPATSWVTVGGQVTPVPWFSVESRYSNPTSGTPGGNPPTHSITRATIRSKFFRTFPSGSFDLKAQIGVESWGDGVIGIDSLSAPIPLAGATFLRAYLELAIGSFRFYYDRTNLAGSDQTYVPGYAIPRYGSTYGVRWSFVN
ncbi:MAG TPA: TonB-dependent receptor plug domain-containing protein [Gemmatimonadales bacterium]|nr:TonB-dependent receptor plug domain-containing protein [Gemmatimonadales bacterium]